MNVPGVYFQIGISCSSRYKILEALWLYQCSVTSYSISPAEMFWRTALFVRSLSPRVSLHVYAFYVWKEATKQRCPRILSVRGSVRAMLQCCAAHVIFLWPTHLLPPSPRCSGSCDIDLTLTFLCIYCASVSGCVALAVTLTICG